MNGRRGDTRRALIGSNADNSCCLSEYRIPIERDYVGTQFEYSGFLHVLRSLKSVNGKVLRSCGMCFSFGSFIERKTIDIHTCQTYARVLTNVVLKRTQAAAQFVFVIGHRTQSMYIQSGVDTEASTSPNYIRYATPASVVRAPWLICSDAFILIHSRHRFTLSYIVLC